MRTALTYVFAIVASLLLGGLVGHRVGGTDRAKVESQRDQALKIAEEYRDLVGKNERAVVKCADTLKVMNALATGCCNEAERALDKLDSCRRSDGKTR